MEKLIWGDCLNVMDNLIAEGVKVDAIVTDPPYNITNTNAGNKKDLQSELTAAFKCLEQANIVDSYDIVSFGEKILKIMKKPNIYLWCNKKQIPEYFDFYVNRHKLNFDILCWHKTNALPTYSNKYLSDTEYCLYFRKGNCCNPQNYEDAKTWWEAPINCQDKKLYKHPTIKPLDMIKRVIRNSTKEGDTVLDPFMGSGTTGVACKNLDRNFIGIELDFNYYMIAEERINNAIQR